MKISTLLGIAALFYCGSASAIAPPSPGSPSANTVALPGAPGSVQGLTAAGQVSGFTGQYSYSLPIDMPPGRAGFKVAMSLTYNGALGNGYMGIGWGFSAPHIQRSTRLGPPAYTDADELELSGIGGGGRLVYIESGLYQGEYRVEGHGQAIRVVRVPADPGEPSSIDTFEVTTSDGTVYTLDIPETCPEDAERPQAPHGVYAWYVSKVEQLPRLPENAGDEGEKAVFDYVEEGGHQRLASIRWTSLGGMPESYAYEAAFSYESRRDRVLSYRAGFKQSIDSRLESVTIWSFGNVRRVYDLAYDSDEDLHLTRLHQITVRGADGLSLPSVTFTYGGNLEPAPEATVAQGTGGWRLGQRGVTLQDVDGDGLSDLARYTRDERSWRKNSGGTFAETPEELTGGANVHLDDIRLMDLDGDLMPEMVYIVDDTWRVYHLNGTTYSGGEIWPGTATIPLAAPDTMFGDLNGDSRTDVFRATFSGTTLSMGGDTALAAPAGRPYISSGDAQLEPGDDNVQLHDVNGDGLADIVWIADPYLKVYWGRGDGTFVTTSKQYCYPWNWKLGKNDDANAEAGSYGCDEQHPEVFDLSNLRLADLDHDGLLDLVRVSAGKVYFYPGYWSEADDIDELSPFGDPVVLARPVGAEYDDVVTIADLNGNGSADVVWSTASGLWILDLSGPATKAMLVSIDNGMGAKTYVDYTTSSLTAIAAEAAGQPWNEQLPTTHALPVQVTSDVPTDPTQPTIVTSYVSRDGFWDSGERIFGGYLEVAETQWGEDNNDTLVTTTRYERGSGSDRVLRGTPYFVQRADGNQMVYDETTTSRSVISVTDLPAATSNPLLAVAVTLEETMTVEEGDCDHAKTLRTTYEYDGYGNVTKESKLGDIAVTGDELVTEHDYVSNTDAWVLFKECQSRTYDPSTAAYFGARSLTVYESNTTPSGGACVGGAGDGRARATYGALCDPEGGASSCGPLTDASTFAGSWIPATETTYDSVGNPVTSWQQGVLRSLEYESDAIFPIRESVGGTPISVEVEGYNYTLGLPERLKDANNDRTAVRYDSLGRILGTWQDLDEDESLDTESPTEQLSAFSYHLSAPRPTIETWVYEHGTLLDTHSTQVFAATGAALYTATEYGSGWIIAGLRERNERGLTVRVAYPFEHGYHQGDNATNATIASADAFQTVRYDALGRSLEQRLPEVPGSPIGGAVHSVAYAPLRTTAQSSGRAAVVAENDGLGRLKHVERVINAVTEEVDAHWSIHGMGGYTLQPDDNVSVLKSFTYDSLGRIISDSDPDSGSRSYTWTNEGWLDSITNAQGDVQVFDYDDAGRLTQRTGYPDAGNLPTSETWTFTYDSDDPNETGLNNNQVGRLATVSGPGGAFENYIYDSAGRVATRSRSVPSGSGGSGLQTISVAMTYSPNGKTLAQRLYDGANAQRIRVETDYDEAGRVRWLGYSVDDNGTLPLYEILDLKASGSPLVERYGNGLGVRFGRDSLDQVVSLDVVNVAGGPVWNRATHTQGGDLPSYVAGFNMATASQIRYQVGIQRNAWGGVTAITDSAIAPHNPSRNATFTYDTAMRLLNAELGETLDVDGSSLGSWVFRYGHDALQNLTEREILDMPDGATTPVMAHGIHDHGDDGLRPRQLRSVQSGESFTYDSVGRMLTRTRPSPLPMQTLSWDAFGRMRTVVEAPEGNSIEHLYGADGERTWSGWFDGEARIRENYRFGGGIELRDQPALGPRYEFTVSGGGLRTVARISVTQSGPSNPRVVYLHPGIGPGPVVLTDSAGAVVEERLYEPFGTALDGTANFDVEPTGWNARAVDSRTTWSDHGARWLGTDFGHWLSPDPRNSEAASPATFWLMAPYQFASASPINFWDPDGYAPAPKDDSFDPNADLSGMTPTMRMQWGRAYDEYIYEKVWTSGRSTKTREANCISAVDTMILKYQDRIPPTVTAHDIVDLGGPVMQLHGTADQFRARKARIEAGLNKAIKAFGKGQEQVEIETWNLKHPNPAKGLDAGRKLRELAMSGEMIGLQGWHNHYHEHYVAVYHNPGTGKLMALDPHGQTRGQRQWEIDLGLRNMHQGPVGSRFTIGENQIGEKLFPSTRRIQTKPNSTD